MAKEVAVKMNHHLLQKRFEPRAPARNTRNHDNMCMFHQFWLVFQFFLGSNGEEEEKSCIHMETLKHESLYMTQGNKVSCERDASASRSVPNSFKVSEIQPQKKKKNPVNLKNVPHCRTYCVGHPYTLYMVS